MSSPPPRLGDLSAVKLALMANKIRAEAQPVLRADPIAIVGMACRVPGGGDTPAHFWEMLRAGRDGIREVPADRWEADAWFDPDPAAPAKSSTKWGGFLDRIDGFDPGYFGILPREAERMDPQQRLFLEVATEALDDAGLTRERLRGSRTGVFVASYHNDYAHLQYNDLTAIDARTLTGILHSVLANRLSYLLDLRGPSLSLDTACSSSLVAVHLACQSLRAGESDVAIAGGVSLMIGPELMIALSKVGFMAPDGRCKAFDAEANGFGRGEGCGLVVCKRLSDAISDGDRILAVVRGSAVNQDGHSTLLAAPNGLAQKAMIEEALGGAQLTPERIGFVEAHGTGTALGDPIEVEALAATVGRPVPGAGGCLLGSVKANLGHLEAAAGVVGLIKAVLALEHQAIPPQPRFGKLSPHIALEGTRLAIATALTPWPAGGTPRCAAVSSFGVGGTNAHVIIEEAPRLPAGEAAPDVSRVLPLSAQSPEALRALAEAWVRFLVETPASAADLCFTAAERRSHHEHRLAVVGASKGDLRARLAEALADGKALGRRAAAPPRVGFVFSGQGPQWYAMGRELLAGEPVFRDVLTECDALLRPLSGWSLLAELGAAEDRSRLAETEVAQPALFGLQVALAALWKSWGLVSDGVLGHSVGEIAALHVAGALTLPDAIRVIWHRGRVMQQATGLGRMAQVSVTADEAAEIVRPFGERLSVGAMNGPRSVVLSGEAAALEEALASVAARGGNHRMLPVQYAFHSAQMAPFERRLADQLQDLVAAAPAVPVYSTVTGALAADQRFDGAYFGRGVSQPVRFAQAITAMGDDGYDVFLEIGPHPALAASITECLDAGGRAAVVLASLRRNRPERETMLQASAGLYAAGAAPAWEAFQQAPGQPVPLPAYPWQRKRYWLRPRPAGGVQPAAGAHPLLGRRVPAAGVGAQLFEADSEAAQAWLPDHRVFGRLVVPGAAVLEIFLVAARTALGATADVTGFAMHRPLFVPEPGEGSTRWQTVVTPAAGRTELALYEATPDGADWRKIASAEATRDGTGAVPEAGAVVEPIDADGVYARYGALGVAFGPSFRCLRDVRRGEGAAEGWLDLPQGLETEARRYALHPVLLDAGLQLCALAAGRAPGGELPAEVMLPLGADRFRVLASAPGRLFARARVREVGAGGSLAADVVFEAHGGERPVVVAVVEGMRLARAEASAFAARDSRDEALYEVGWRRVAEAPGPRARAEGTWLLFGAASGADVAAALAAAGGRVCLVRSGDGFTNSAPDAFTVDPAAPEHFARVLEDVGPLRGVLHLASLEPAPAAREDLLVTGSLLHLVQGLVGAGAACPLWVVTRGAQAASGDENEVRLAGAGAWGLASVVAVEHPELEVRRIDLDPDEPLAAAALVDEVLASGEPVRSVALRGAERWSPRLERRRAPATGPLRVELVRPGTLDGVELRPAPRAELRPGEVRLRVLAAGINFRDVLTTLGMVPGAAAPLGVECAGEIVEVGAGVSGFAVGTRAFGYAPTSLGTEVVVPAAFLAPLPAGLRPEEAAGIPVAFLTALYGFERLARLRSGQRVLIHAAAGGVGLAAVQLAQRIGAEVFATAGSPEKRAFVRALGVKHVMDSRSLTFAEEIRAATAGEGVHVVLNSLAGDFIPASLGVLAHGGAFLELGKRDVMTPDAAARARPDLRYHLYDLGVELQADHGLARPMLDDVLAGIAAGTLRPLPVKVYPLDHVRDAFRFMAQAKHVGKIVVRPPAAIAGPLVSGAATYWITGGLGGLGLETARWLVEAGARTLVLNGRRPPSARAAAVIAELERSGAVVRVFAADAADRPAMERILADIRTTLPPLRGVIHAAGVVDDGVLVHQSWERCQAVLRAKAHGARLLDELTRAEPLDFFVLYSAASLLLGAPGQGAYPAANAELDALAHDRRRQGLPALSVAWGAWADVGMAAELAARGPDVWAARGLDKINPALGFARLETLLREGATHAAVLPIRWPQFLAQLSAGADRAFFAALAAEAAPTPPPAAGAGPSVVARLQATPAGQRRQVLTDFLTERALQVLGLEATTAVNAKVPLKEIGLDSLMAVELRNTLARAVGKPLPATLLFDYPTLDALAGHLARTLGLEPEAGAATPIKAAPPGAVEIAALSDAEADAMLLAELEGGTARSTHGG